MAQIICICPELCPSCYLLENNHQQFYVIKRADGILLWLTVIWLLFVALVPFSTSLISEYDYLQYAQIFFDINMFLIGVFSALIWYYVTEKKFIDKEVTPQRIHEIRRLNLMLPLLSLIAIGITFISPSWSSATYALLPLIKRIMEA